MHGGLVLWLKGWARMAESRRRAGERREGRCHKMGRSVFQTLLGMGESRVMCRWTCSLWKLLWQELLCYTILFLLISLMYRCFFTDAQQTEFERLIRLCRNQSAGLPITFLLGFYVTLIVRRWWEQYTLLPWPDTIAIFLRGLVEGEGDQPRLVRRTIIRYILLAYILCLRQLSIRLRKRFPSMKELARTGIVRADEAARIGEEDSLEMYESNWCLPIKWSVEVISRAQKDGLIKTAPGYSHMMLRLSEFRTGLTKVATYGHIPVPLVYTQVVHLAVYVYFAASLVGEQWIIKGRSDFKRKDEEVDLYYPIFMTFRFLFVFGWLRVAETLYNPFGEDDDDFELNELLNRHFKVAMTIVDDTEEPPQLQKDIFWNQTEPELISDPGWSEAEVLRGNGEVESGAPEEEEEVLRHSHSALSAAERRDPRL